MKYSSEREPHTYPYERDSGKDDEERVEWPSHLDSQPHEHSPELDLYVPNIDIDPQT